MAPTRTADTALVLWENGFGAQREEELLLSGAIGKGWPARLSNEELLERIGENPVSAQEAQEAAAAVHAAVAWMIDKKKDEGARRARKAVGRMVDQYVELRRSMIYFYAAPFVVSDEEFLLGFHRRMGVGIAVDFLNYLRSLEGSWIEHPRREGRLAAIDKTLAQRLIAEYVFHELHGEDRELSHHELYASVQHDILRRFFGEKNLLKIFIRKFVDKHSALRKARAYLLHPKRPASIESLLRFAEECRVAARKIEDSCQVTKEDRSVIRSLKRMDRIDLHPSVSPEAIHDFLSREGDNRRMFWDDNAEDFVFLFCEMLRRLKGRQKEGVETRTGPLAVHHISGRFAVLKDKLIQILGPCDKDPDRFFAREKRFSAALQLHALGVRGLEGVPQAPIDPQWLRGGYLRGVDFTQAPQLFGGETDLTDADARESNLSGLDLRRTILTGTNLAGASIQRAKLNPHQIDDIPGETRDTVHIFEWRFPAAGFSIEQSL